jgi:dTMP kinase
MPNMPGEFLMIDGIAGSGKTTILRALADHLEQSETSVFRLSDWFDANDRPPTFPEVKDADVLFTFEPTKAWIGAAIRGEMSRTDAPYSANELAQAFAIDRHVMYKRLIVPALRSGKTVIQDRGVSTSIVYQPIMDETIDLDAVTNLEGNRFALRWAPNRLILTDVDPKIAYERLHGRDEESRGVFAQLDALQHWSKRFHSKWLAELFEKHGTTIEHIDTSVSKQDSIEQAKQMITSLLKTP